MPFGYHFILHLLTSVVIGWAGVSVDKTAELTKVHAQNVNKLV